MVAGTAVDIFQAWGNIFFDWTERDLLLDCQPFVDSTMSDEEVADYNDFQWTGLEMLGIRVGMPKYINIMTVTVNKDISRSTVSNCRRKMAIGTTMTITTWPTTDRGGTCRRRGESLGRLDSCLGMGPLLVSPGHVWRRCRQREVWHYLHHGFDPSRRKRCSGCGTACSGQLLCPAGTG